MDLERKFHQTLIDGYKRAREDGYNATRYLQMLAENEGLSVAKQFLHSNTASHGFFKLIEMGKYDLTVEYAVLLPEFAPLFTEEEKRIARERLLEINIPPELLPETQGLHEEKNQEMLKFPPLNPSGRVREYRTYKPEIRMRIIYEYLFNSISHRQLDEKVLGLDSKQSRGYQSMGVLHYVGLRNDHKGIFKGWDIEEAIAILEANGLDSDHIIIQALKFQLKNGQDIDWADDSLMEDEAYAEGRRAFRLHRTIERNPKVVRQAKAAFIRKYGSLYCEACGINFEEIYGERGKDFIEAHHIKPVSEMNEGDKTSINDLRMLCSNCHRMIHREPMISVEELKELITKQRQKTGKIHSS